MSRFTEEQRKKIYSSSYTRPRKVTMITNFDPPQDVVLQPMTKIIPTQPPEIRRNIKWVKISASIHDGKDLEGWIPKSALHDFAYGELVHHASTGASYGGDKIDADKNKPTAYLKMREDGVFIDLWIINARSVQTLWCKLGG